MSDFNAYRIDVEKRKGAWWLTVRKNIEGAWTTIPVSKDSVFSYARWRLTPSFDDGWFVLPIFWRKPLAERVMLAVELAYNAITSDMGCDKQGLEEQQWTEFANRTLADLFAKEE